MAYVQLVYGRQLQQPVDEQPADPLDVSAMTREQREALKRRILAQHPELVDELRTEAVPSRSVEPPTRADPRLVGSRPRSPVSRPRSFPGSGEHCRHPHTVAGRIIAIALMLLGVGFLAVLTATVASHFVQVDQGDSNEQILETLKRIEADVAHLKAQLPAPQ